MYENLEQGEHEADGALGWSSQHPGSWGPSCVSAPPRGPQGLEPLVRTLF